MKIRIKLQDKVMVMTGKDRGKEGKVIQVLPEEHMVVVDGVNKTFKNIRPQRKGETGQRIEFSGPIRLSKVMLVCPRCSKPARIGMKSVGDAMQRMCKKCKEVID
jgi:large subunit ribosomal protein L24